MYSKYTCNKVCILIVLYEHAIPLYFIHITHTYTGVCQDLLPLENGVITYNSENENRIIGTVATYMCNVGFIYVGGDVTRTCTNILFMGVDVNNIDWTGMGGRCIRELLMFSITLVKVAAV